jgi:hypothetical protein
MRTLEQMLRAHQNEEGLPCDVCGKESQGKIGDTCPNCKKGKLMPEGQGKNKHGRQDIGEKVAATVAKPAMADLSRMMDVLESYADKGLPPKILAMFEKLHGSMNELGVALHNACDEGTFSARKGFTQPKTYQRPEKLEIPEGSNFSDRILHKLQFVGEIGAPMSGEEFKTQVDQIIKWKLGDLKYSWVGDKGIKVSSEDAQKVMPLLARSGFPSIWGDKEQALMFSVPDFQTDGGSKVSQSPSNIQQGAEVR